MTLLLLDRERCDPSWAIEIAHENCLLSLMTLVNINKQEQEGIGARLSAKG